MEGIIYWNILGFHIQLCSKRDNEVWLQWLYLYIKSIIIMCTKLIVPVRQAVGASCSYMQLYPVMMIVTDLLMSIDHLQHVIT